MSTVTVDDASNADRDVIVRQYVWPLASGQTINGSQALKAQVRGSETSANNNMFLVVGIRVLASDGTTVRKVVLAPTRDNTEFATSLTNRQFTATSAAGNYSTVSGDYLVIEVGAGGDPSGGNHHDFSLRLGDSAGADLSEDNSSTTDNRPWVELADTLTMGPEAVSGSDSAAVNAAEGTTAIAEETAPADSMAVAITEAAPVAEEATATDSLAVAVSEASELVELEAIEASDTLDLALAETAAVVEEAAASDALALGLTESVAIAESAAPADSLDLALAEVVAVFEAAGPSDSLAIAVAEEPQAAEETAPADSLVVGLTEAVTAHEAAGPTDSLSVALTESTATHEETAPADSLALALTEGAADVDEEGGGGGPEAVSDADSLAMAVSDAHLGTVEAAAPADSLAVALTEAAAIYDEIAAADDAALAVAEAVAIIEAAGAIDALDVALTDGAAIQDFDTGEVDVADSLALVVAEVATIADRTPSITVDIGIPRYEARLESRSRDADLAPGQHQIDLESGGYEADLGGNNP